MNRFQQGEQRRGQLQSQEISDHHHCLVSPDEMNGPSTMLPRIPSASRRPWTHGISSSSFDDDDTDDEAISLVEEKKSCEPNELACQKELAKVGSPVETQTSEQLPPKPSLPKMPPSHTNGVSVSFCSNDSDDFEKAVSNESSRLPTGPARARCYSYQSFHQEPSRAKRGGGGRHRRKESLGDEILGAVGQALQPIRHFGKNVFGGDPARFQQHNHHERTALLRLSSNPEAPKKSTNPRVVRAWRVLREKVRSGEVLLERPPSSHRRRSVLKHQSTKSQRWRKREEFQESIRSGLEFNLTQCLAVMVVYMLMSVMAFSFLFDNWTLVDSMYFALVTCTTIGYGDLVPQTFAGRLFTCFYALTGVCCLGIALGILGSHIVATEEKAVEQTSNVAKKRLLSLFSAPKAAEVAQLEADDEQYKSLEEKTKERELFLDEAIPDAKPNPLWKLFFHFCLVMVLLAVFSLVILRDPGLGLTDFDFFDAFYFSIVTATTVGYGDFAPTSQQGRLFTIFFIPLAVGAMGHFLSTVAEEIMKSRSDAVRERLAAQELCQTDLEIMDADGDGTVTRAEFLEFMLVSLNKVDKDFIEELRRHFDKLDVDGTGVLSKEDLVYQARQKLQRIHRKLELSSYKQDLLRKAAAARQQQRTRMGGLDWNRGEGLGGSLMNVSTFFSNMMDDTENSSNNTHDDSSIDSQGTREPFSGTTPQNTSMQLAK